MRREQILKEGRKQAFNRISKWCLGRGPHAGEPWELLVSLTLNSNSCYLLVKGAWQGASLLQVLAIFKENKKKRTSLVI